MEITPPELGFAIEIGDLTVTECQMVNQFAGSKTEPPQFTRGYGLVFGHGERKAMAMALVDRSLRAEELGEDATAPAQKPGIRAVPLRQCRGDRLRRAPEAAALRRFPGELEKIRQLRAERRFGTPRNDDRQLATTSATSTSTPSG